MTTVIGLISGTSVDGIDAALVNVTGTKIDLQVDLIAGATYPYPAALRDQILAVCAGAPLSMADFAALDDAIANQFAEAAIAIQSGRPPADLIGSHGQTVFHRPPNLQSRTPKIVGETQQLSRSNAAYTLGYSLQLGRGATISELTGITTISNFRAADIAAGGQGAPMVPPVDACLLGHDTEHRCIQNIGGIGNLTYLPAHASPHASVLGWDTGPGNALLDLAVQHLSNGEKTYDENGAWAASGTPCQALVETWLQHDFFQQPPPKSTGRELFSPVYLQRCLQNAEGYGLDAADCLATLTELTAASIVHSYRMFLPQMPDRVILAGGGSRNRYLAQRLQMLLDPIPVCTSDEMGVDADFKEAIAFAVLAYWRQLGIPGNLPEVTGARHAALLGEIHLVANGLDE